MNTLTKISARQKTQSQQLDSVYLDNFKQPAFLQGVIEGFIDGILVISKQGEWIHANDCARRICFQLAEGDLKFNSVPQAIWHICQVLIESHTLFPNKTIIFYDDIVTGNSTAFRIRVQWLELKEIENSYLLVTLEDRYQSTQNMAIAEAEKYGLTPRETDVWLLFRAKYTYKEIAAELYITLNTVKKHMKNVHAKRKVIVFTNDE